MDASFDSEDVESVTRRVGGSVLVAERYTRVGRWAWEREEEGLGWGRITTESGLRGGGLLLECSAVWILSFSVDSPSSMLVSSYTSGLGFRDAGILGGAVCAASAVK